MELWRTMENLDQRGESQFLALSGEWRLATRSSSRPEERRK
jgi:hypothetical protein